MGIEPGALCPSPHGQRNDNQLSYPPPPPPPPPPPSYPSCGSTLRSATRRQTPSQSEPQPLSGLARATLAVFNEVHRTLRSSSATCISFVPIGRNEVGSQLRFTDWPNPVEPRTSHQSKRQDPPLYRHVPMGCKSSCTSMAFGLMRLMGEVVMNQGPSLPPLYPKGPVSPPPSGVRTITAPPSPSLSLEALPPVPCLT